MEQETPLRGIAGFFKQLLQGTIGIVVFILSVSICAAVGFVSIFISPILIIIATICAILLMVWTLMKLTPKNTRTQTDEGNENVVDGSAEYTKPDESQSVQLPQARKRR